MSFVFLAKYINTYYYYHPHFICDGTKNGDVKPLAQFTELIRDRAEWRCRCFPSRTCLSVSVPWSLSHWLHLGETAQKAATASGPHLLYPCDFTAIQGYSETRQKRVTKKNKYAEKENVYFSHYLNNETISSGKFRIISWKIIGMNSPI